MGLTSAAQKADKLFSQIFLIYLPDETGEGLIFLRNTDLR